MRTRTVSGLQPAYRSNPASRSQPTLGTRRRPSPICTSDGMVNAGTVQCRALNRGLPSFRGSLRKRVYASARYLSVSRTQANG